MKNDTAGAVMANALLKAADRGVRIRFLLDDVFTTVPDNSFLLINKHPNIEIRIFNPVSRSGIYAFNFVGQFDRANRRMHNKSFTVDHSISVVGGRNIADEYFQLKENAVFVDLDVLAVGPILENDAGRLEWHARIDNQDVIETKEPLTGWWRRFKAWFMKIAPESQM
jgi:putative cardiolipin synthase